MSESLETKTKILADVSSKALLVTLNVWPFISSLESILFS